MDSDRLSVNEKIIILIAIILATILSIVCFVSCPIIIARVSALISARLKAKTKKLKKKKNGIMPFDPQIFSDPDETIDNMSEIQIEQELSRINSLTRQR